VKVQEGQAVRETANRSRRQLADPHVEQNPEDDKETAANET
jgi:hypothetical protein